MRHVRPKTLHHHDHPQKEDRIHGAVFQIGILLDLVDTFDRQLPDNDRAQAVAQDNERHGHGKGERPDNAVDRERRVQDLQIHDLADIR